MPAVCGIVAGQKKVKEYSNSKQEDLNLNARIVRYFRSCSLPFLDSLQDTLFPFKITVTTHL